MEGDSNKTMDKPGRRPSSLMPGAGVTSSLILTQADSNNIMATVRYMYILTNASIPAEKINSQLYWRLVHQTPWIDVCIHTSSAGSIVNGVISGHGTITCYNTITSRQILSRTHVYKHTSSRIVSALAYWKWISSGVQVRFAPKVLSVLYKGTSVNITHPGASYNITSKELHL